MRGYLGEICPIFAIVAKRWQILRAKMAQKGTNWPPKFGIVAKPFATVV